MKNQKIKKKSIATKVVGSVSLTIFLMCVTLSLAMWNAFQRELTIAETKYMSEVLTRISLEINGELNHFIDVTQGIAVSHTLKEFLYNVENGALETNGLGTEESEDFTESEDLDVVEELELPEETDDFEAFMGVDDTEELEESEEHDEYYFPEESQENVLEGAEVQENTSGMVESATLSSINQFELSQISGYDDVIEELNAASNTFGDSVTYVTLCSIYYDDFVTQDEQSGGNGFSLTNRPYFEAYNKKSTYITDPYEDILSGNMVLSIAEPIFDETGRVFGLLIIEMNMEQLSKICTSVTFGTTGATMLLDRNNNILAYPDPSLVGKNVSALNYSGENAERELNSPTGAILDYQFGTTTRIGGIVEISELSGFKILSAVDSNEMKENISVVITRLNLGLFLAIIISTSLCSTSIFKNLAPMKKLEEFMEELSQGNLKSTVDYDGPDEIGRLADHMNRTAETLSGYIGMIDKAMKAFGTGDLRRPDGIDFRGDFVEVEDSIIAFAEMFSNSLKEIKVSLEQMNQGSSQVASGAHTLSHGSAEQAGSVEQLNGLIGSINETIVTTAKNSSSVTSDAQNISDELVISNGKMQELVVSVQDIREMSDEVKRIIKTIEDVAFQTNILSLNASVEAARAGTSGKGFAVVADEVRNLSFKTAQAAEETTKIINDIANAIETGTDLAQTTSTELQKVVDDVGVFVDKISRISLSAQDQADAIGEINMGIEKISQVVIQNSAISEESAAASQELSAQSDQMVILLEQFKLRS